MDNFFRYVDITTKGCEGWLNLFFGEHVIALINNPVLADEIREAVDSHFCSSCGTYLPAWNSNCLCDKD